MANKYVLTKSSNCLHMIDGCYHSKHTNNDPNYYKYFETVDDVISEYQNHFKFCKRCFKER